MNRKISANLAVLFVFLALAAGCFMGGIVVKRSLGPAAEKAQYIERLLDTFFVGDYVPEKLADAAADAMIQATGDPWSSYLSKDAYAAYQVQSTNQYTGLGITVSVNEPVGNFLISRVQAEGPAAAAGLMPGDLLTAVDGTSVVGVSLEELSSILNLRPGTPVTLTILRNGTSMSFSAAPQVLSLEVTVSAMLEGGIGYIRILNFDASSCDETLKAIDSMMEQGAAALVFDLRFNPGGRKTELVEILDRLLPEGVLFRSRDYAGKESTDYSDAAALEIPMAVLVNEQSYSAAEYMAAALQEYGAAVIVGDETVGKGRYQVVLPLEDGSAVALSVGEYFTPQGRSLAGVGITPDVSVSLSKEAAQKLYAQRLEPSEDTQLAAALDLLRSASR